MLGGGRFVKGHERRLTADLCLDELVIRHGRPARDEACVEANVSPAGKA
jgi:hypothetical protein